MIYNFNPRASEAEEGGLKVQRFSCIGKKSRVKSDNWSVFENIITRNYTIYFPILGS